MEFGGTASRVEIVILACKVVTEFVQVWKFLSSPARMWELVPVRRNCFGRGDSYTRLQGGDGICSSVEILELARKEVGAGPCGKAHGPCDGMELGERGRRGPRGRVATVSLVEACSQRGGNLRFYVIKKQFPDGQP